MKNQWYGWTGRHLRINLTKQTVSIKENNVEYMKSYLGARGIGIKYLTDEMAPNVDAFSPKNIFIFMKINFARYYFHQSKEH